MSKPDCAFGYSQARLQARLAARPTEADWQRLRASGDLAALLQACRASSLARWTAGLDARAGVHDLEQHLRANWIEQVNEVARWQPEPWRASVRWLSWLPYLPSLAKLARGGRPPNWMRCDPLLGPIVATEPRQRAGALRRTPLAPLEAAFGARAAIPRAWAEHWRHLWPPRGPFEDGRTRLLRAVATYLDELQGLPLTSRGEEAESRLARRLLTTLRRNPLTPVSAMAYLGLTALDFTQLRGVVAARALHAGPALEAAA